MSKEAEYRYHTITIGQRQKIVATQKYTFLPDGEVYYLGSFDYVVFDHQHIIATGNISGSNQGKLKEEKVQETFNRVMEQHTKW